MKAIFNRPVPLLDAFLRLTARLIPGVVSGSVFYCPELPWLRWDRWTEDRAYMVQVGRFEVVLDRG